MLDSFTVGNFPWRMGARIVRTRVVTRLVATLLLAGFVTVATSAQQRQAPNVDIPPPPPEPVTEPPPPVEEPPPTVELSANLVTIAVVARGANGELVTDLTAADFAVYEDGKAQEVDQFFRQGEVPPLRLALLFDSSLSVRTRLDFEKRAASRFFSQAFRAGDQAALYSVASSWTLLQPLTGSVGALVDATDHIEAGGTTSLYGAIIAASHYLGESDGRRILVLLTDGYDNAAKETLTQTLEVAQRHDIIMYGISPAGTGDSKSQVAKLGSAALNQLCEQTGGRAFFPAIEMSPEAEVQSLDSIYERIIAELQAQYVLIYYSNDPAKDGRFRKLKVDVRRPGVSVSARKGYYAR